MSTPLIDFLFNTAPYPARWHCGQWQDWIGWTYISSDFAIFLAYVGIPASLLYYKDKAKTTILQLNYIFYLFSAFILFCGFTHLIDAIIFWEPIYNFAGLIKLITAIISLSTLFVIFTKLPVTLQFINQQHEAKSLKVEIESLRAQEAQRALADVEEKNTKLKELDQLKSDFMANISHELRTPLTLILAPLETLLSDPSKLTLFQQDHMQRMQRNALRLYYLVNDLLDYSKLEAGKFVINDELIDINKLTFQVVDDAKGLAEARRVMLTFTECHGLEQIMLDKIMVEKIILNLLSNALKFTNEGGKVNIHIQKQNNNIQLIVSDTGIGISPAQIARLFERFHQIHSSKTKAYEGTGIGLAIAAQFAKLLGGEIQVSSELNKGTTFTVTLPIRLENSTVENVTKDEKIVNSINTSLSLIAKNTNLHHNDNADHEDIKRNLPLILISDDNDDMREYIVSLLKNRYNILTAKNGQEALKSIYQYHPQVVLSDVMMPIIDGYELTKRMKEDPSISHIPIILITAKSGKDSIMNSLGVGADDYICKPFSNQELTARTDAALRSYHSYYKLMTLNKQLDDTNKKLTESSDELSKINQELKATQTQLVQHSMLVSVGQLSAGVAHEINTPIQYIGDNTRFLKDSFTHINQFICNIQTQLVANESHKDLEQFFTAVKTNFEKLDFNFISKEVPEAIDQSLEGVERVSEIVKSMRQFSHTGSHEKTPTDLNSALHNIIAVSKNEWKYVAKIESKFDPNLPLASCQPNEINQVFLNLIVNAAHAIEAKNRQGDSKSGIIEIQTKKDGEFVEISVKDTGAGIPENIRNRIFEPFFTTKEVGKGTGQGLSIAHSIIVGKHNGQLTFDSKEGEGTTFTVRLPIH